jgi:hypothetical protein
MNETVRGELHRPKTRLFIEYYLRKKRFSQTLNESHCNLCTFSLYLHNKFLRIPDLLTKEKKLTIEFLK